MEPIKVVSVALLVLGIVILVVLTTLGGVIKKTLDDTIYDRLEYDMPKGKEQCYRSTKAMFYDEYYLWNLTNEAEFIQGQEPHFNLTGPYSYTQWYCHFNHSLNKDTGYLQYRTSYEGYRFIRGDSALDDTVKITNINPAYLGILRQIQTDQAIPAAASNQALLGIITQLQSKDFIQLVWMLSSPVFLQTSTQARIAGATVPSAASVLLTDIVNSDNFFNNTFSGQHIQSWATFASTNYSGSVTVNPTIFTELTAASTLDTVSKLQPSDLVTRYTLASNDEGASLSAYISALISNAFVKTTASNQAYYLWANSNSTSDGWSLGTPSAGISASDANAVLNPAMPCALTNSATGIYAWVYFLTGKTATLCPGVPVGYGGFSFANTTQLYVVLNWFNTYLSGVVGPTLLSSYNAAYGLTNWNDFAYLQWGQGVFPPGGAAGQGTVQQLVGLPYAPEAAHAGAIFTLAAAKELLNGTHGLFNSANMQEFLAYGQKSDFISIMKTWPQITLANGLGFQAYLQNVIIAQITIPAFNQTYLQNGSGLITTRTAREWLFTAEDNLLRNVLGPDAAKVALVGNLTRTRQEAENFNYTYYRVYTGSNDLHWSLMPYNNGTNVTYWNGTMLITGYNGTQFLPNGYLDDPKLLEEYPLTLWHRLINRTIPFKVVGKDKWEDVNVRYLTMTDDALLSADKNPVNSLYYSKYSGTIDKSTNPPYLPAFLTTPSFLSAEESFKQNISFTDNIWLPSYDGKTNNFSTHRYSLFLLVEPKLGSTLWGNLPIQVNFKFGPTYFYPKIKPGFAPIYWNAIGDKASSKDLDTIKDSLYAGETAWKALIGVGVGVGVLMIAGGAVGLVIYRKQKGVKVDA